MSAPVRSLAAVSALRSTISDRRTATWRHQDYLGYDRTRSAFRERTTSAAPYLRWIRSLWAHRAHRYWRLTLVTLRDFEVRDGNHAWLKAVDEVQRVFPGTRDWLRSCSAPTSEGGWGRWVTYRDAYSAEYAAAHYIVGGWLQFKLPTFKGMFQRALDTASSRGYRIPRDLRTASDIEAWQSPLAQALAGGWAATNGEKGHWVGSGC